MYFCSSIRSLTDIMKFWSINQIMITKQWKYNRAEIKTQCDSFRASSGHVDLMFHQWMSLVLIWSNIHTHCWVVTFYMYYMDYESSCYWSILKWSLSEYSYIFMNYINTYYSHKGSKLLIIYWLIIFLFNISLSKNFSLCHTIYLYSQMLCR